MKNQERPTVQAAQPADETGAIKTDAELITDAETQMERAEPGVGAETKRTKRQAKRQLGEAVLAVERSEQKSAVDAEDEVRYWANNYNTTEGQFRHFCQRLQRGEWELGPERYQENVRRYENDLAIDWQRSEEALADMGCMSWRRCNSWAAG